MFRVEYKHKNTGRDFGSVFVQTSKGVLENVGVAMLREGLASLKGRNLNE